MISFADGWSVGETSSLAIKAARGVGMPWGIAEEAGFALRWLIRSGAPGVAAICRYLSAYERAMKVPEAGSTLVTPCDWICPLHLGTAISDGGISLPFEQSSVREPLLLLPFLASQATDSHSVVLKMGTKSIIVSTDGFSTNMVEAAMLINEANCTIDFGSVDSGVTKQIGYRIPSTAIEHIETLNRFAHKTYAPATEESRKAGAGASLNDND